MLHILFVLTLIIVPMIFQQPSTMIIAHRGASHDAPENTLASVNLAWEIGADAAEVDVHLSKDKRIMVIHDGDTKRTTGENMLIRESMSSDLRSLDASNSMDQFRGERIPFLEEVMATVPEGKVLFVEVNIPV
jgi:glycerophosphoryl diester phosphodiesterase